MFKKIVPLQKDQHGDLKIKSNNSFLFASKFHVASIMANEFYRAASTYPIVFIEDATKDAFIPVVLLGLNPQQNLFVNDEGKWDATYVPAILRRYPFALAKTGEEDRYTVCIDEESDFFSKEEGEALFDESGNPQQLLENVKLFLGSLHQMEALTKQFSDTLKEHNMLAPLNMKVKQSDAVQNITGAYAVNEQRLNNLSDETFLELRKKNMLPLIYSHLTSLTQIERLVQLKDKTISKEKTLPIQKDSVE
ncbi:MAG: SapC family protein [Chlorobiaceae bacterium]|nr:SapC family protein [Chlorobiaceae bacterium]